MAGTTVNPYRFGGQVGYRRDAPARQFVRARHLDTASGRWASRDPLNFGGGDTNLYRYSSDNPARFVDPSGLTAAPSTCQQILDCLYQTRPSCTQKGKHDSSPSLMLCVFWQETSWGKDGVASNEGPGSCTRDCFNVLKGRDGEFPHNRCSYLNKYKTYQDFERSATQCEKMWAAQDYLSFVGLRRFGPPYPPSTIKKLKNCGECIDSGARSGGPAVANDFCYAVKCCLGGVHG